MLGRGCLLCLLWMLMPGAVRAQLIMDFAPDPDGALTISESSPGVILTLFNSGSEALSLGGVNFFLKIGGGLQGPTLSTTAPPELTAGVDLLTGTPFTAALAGQLPISTADFGPRSQAWSATLVPPSSLGAGQTVRLATLTFNSFPAGSYPLDFTGTTFPWYNTVSGEVNNHPVLLPADAELTAVPEPVRAALATGLGLLAIAGWRRVRAHSL